MNDPIAKAMWVIETFQITDIPALSLKKIAEKESIICRFIDFPDDTWLAGMLLYKRQKRKIIVNTHIPSPGRHNFTFAHELGHYFMKHPPGLFFDGQSGFKCTGDDIEKEQKPRETEANKFAAELLMPENRFKFDMIGADIDFTLINSLSNLYMVSKHACSNRILFFTTTPCIIIRTRGQMITGYCESCAARGFLKKMNTVPDDTFAYNVITNQQWQYDFIKSNSENWLIRAIPGNKVYECTHFSKESSTAMTILKW